VKYICIILLLFVTESYAQPTIHQSRRREFAAAGGCTTATPGTLNGTYTNGATVCTLITTCVAGTNSGIITVATEDNPVIPSSVTVNGTTATMLGDTTESSSGAGLFMYQSSVYASGACTTIVAYSLSCKFAIMVTTMSCATTATGFQRAQGYDGTSVSFTSVSANDIIVVAAGSFSGFQYGINLWNVADELKPTAYWGMWYYTGGGNITAEWGAPYDEYDDPPNDNYYGIVNVLGVKVQP
jgi:hypothetical protein